MKEMIAFFKENTIGNSENTVNNWVAVILMVIISILVSDISQSFWLRVFAVGA